MLAGTLLGVAVALLVSFNVLLVWVATGPRTLDALTPFIEGALSSPEGSYTIDIGDTLLLWDGWERPIDVRLRNVSVLTRQGQKFSRFPEISLGLDLLELLRGALLPSSIKIVHPVINLFQKNDRSIHFGFRDEEALTPSAQPAITEGAGSTQALPFEVIVAQMLEPSAQSPLRKLRTFTIVDADIRVGNEERGVFFMATDANVVFKKNRRGVLTYGDAKIAYEDKLAAVAADILLPVGEKTLQGNLSFSELYPGLIADLFSDGHILSGLKLPLRGHTSFTLDHDAKLRNAEFMLEGGSGQITHERLTQAVDVQALRLEGFVSGGMTDININDFQVQLAGDSRIQGQLLAVLEKGKESVTGRAQALAIPNDALETLWPLGLAPLSREWVTQNIRGGSYTEAAVTFDIKPGDLDLPILPRESIDAQVLLEGASIRYLPEHPPVSAVNGRMFIDGLSLRADISQASYLSDTRLMAGSLRIPDLNEDNPYISLVFDASSTGRDIVKFLSFPRLGHTQRLNLSEEEARGQVSGTAELGFRFFAPADGSGEDGISYRLAARMEGVAQPKFLGRFDISDAGGQFTLDNQQLTFTGSGTVNGASVSNASVSYWFQPVLGYDTFIEAQASAPAESLPRFGYPKLPGLSGVLGVDVAYRSGQAKEDVSGTFDLTQAGVSIPAIYYDKPAGEKLSVHLLSQKRGAAQPPLQFAASGSSTSATGVVALTAGMGDIESVHAQGVRYRRTELSEVRYASIPGGLSLNLTGDAADVAPWVERRKGEPGTFSFEKFPALSLNVNVKNVLLGEGRALSGVRGSVECTAQRCQTADVKGNTIDGKPFAFRILKNPKGKRQLSLRAESAGHFLRALGVFDGMEGGDLTLTGTYQDSPAGSVLKGRADGTGYTVKNAPVLAKILSLASLTGFFDALSGKGITFTRLRAPFTLENDVITLKDAKTFGNAMGLSLDGTIRFPGQKLDLKGTLVPSYSLNTVLGSVPVIGDVLMGGADKGIFAASYTIKGAGDEPEVGVNPLSILTPGFLRGLFDIFDTPSKEAAE